MCTHAHPFAFLIRIFFIFFAFNTIARLAFLSCDLHEQSGKRVCTHTHPFAFLSWLHILLRRTRMFAIFDSPSCSFFLLLIQLQFRHLENKQGPTPMYMYIN